METGTAAAAARRLHRGARDGQHRPGGRHGRGGRAGLAARPRRRATATSSRSAPSPSGWPASRLAELGTMADSAARVRVFSDDGRCVSDPLLMRRALEYVKAFDGVIAQHAQEPQAHRGRAAQRGRDVRAPRPGRLARRGRGGRSSRATACSPRTSARRCTSATSPPPGRSEIIRWAKSKGWPVTAEVTPHHLLLTDELAAGYDPVFKVNPPLRTEADVAELRRGPGRRHHRLRGHRPRPAPGGGQGVGVGRGGRFGMTGLETALRVVQRGDGRDRAAGLGRGRGPDVGPARQDRAADRARPPADTGRARSPHPVRPGGARRGGRRRPGRPRAGTRPSPGWSCRAGWSPPSCAASRPCSTESWPEP